MGVLTVTIISITTLSIYFIRSSININKSTSHDRQFTQKIRKLKEGSIPIKNPLNFYSAVFKSFEMDLRGCEQSENLPTST